jgi:hypothetical protein
MLAEQASCRHRGFLWKQAKKIASAAPAKALWLSNRPEGKPGRPGSGYFKRVAGPSVTGPYQARVSVRVLSLSVMMPMPTSAPGASPKAFS